VAHLGVRATPRRSCAGWTRAVARSLGQRRREVGDNGRVPHVGDSGRRRRATRAGWAVCAAGLRPEQVRARAGAGLEVALACWAARLRGSSLNVCEGEIRGAAADFPDLGQN
jgi:hypothetical protein